MLKKSQINEYNDTTKLGPLSSVFGGGLAMHNNGHFSGLDRLLIGDYETCDYLSNFGNLVN